MFTDQKTPPGGHRSVAGRSLGRRSGRWATLVRRFGWRAYALPILSAITIAALIHTDPSIAASHDASRTGVTDPARQASPSTPRSTNSAETGAVSPPVQVEGRPTGASGFRAPSTPPAAPVVVSLGDDGISCATNANQQLLVVSISKQHLWACEGGKQVNSTAVTTGATVDNDQTPLGSWRVQAKQRDRYLVGPGYRDYVHYWVPFNGDFGLHDASWQTMPFGSPDYLQHGSHGCVHVPSATMAWLYQWASVNDTVVTVEA